MRILILGVTAALLLVAGCTPVEVEGAGTPAQTASSDPDKEFVARVVGDTEEVWDTLFRAMGKPSYPKPRVVIFSGRVVSACGSVSGAVGPHYCPTDRKVYLDTAYFGELSRRFGAPGNFAQAYLIAREISHHVQNALGTMQKFEQALSGVEERQRNEMRVRLELQADCYTGVWTVFRAEAQPA